MYEVKFSSATFTAPMFWGKLSDLVSIFVEYYAIDQHRITFAYIMHANGDAHFDSGSY